MIVYLKHHQIDYPRWDEAITNSHNGLVYALSWYLDIVSPGWEALVEGDYEYVMPLPVKQKFFIPYIVKPYFNQQLGVFSKKVIDADKVADFLAAIPAKFMRYNFNLNSGNPSGKLKHAQPFVNYELLLNKSFDEHFRLFNENTRRNCKKARAGNLTSQLISQEVFLHGFLKANPQLDLKVLGILQKLMDTTQHKGLGEIYGVMDGPGNCIAGVYFVKALNRMIYLASFSLSDGKNNSAMFLLVENLIKTYAESGMILDFEGSNIPGVARFFAGFGSENILYPNVIKQLF